MIAIVINIMASVRMCNVIQKLLSALRRDE